MTHPTLDEIVLAREGQLRPADTQRVLTHVQRCTSCQTQERALAEQAAIATSRVMPADHDVRRFHAHLTTFPAAARPHRRATTHLLAIAAAALLFIVLRPYVQGPSSDSVLAAELLETWSRQETPDTRNARWTFAPMFSSDVSRHAPQDHSTPCAFLRSPDTPAVLPASQSPLPADIRATLAAHCFEPEQPLSVAGYARWYRSLTEHTDHITRQNRWTTITVHTTTTQIRRATLLVDSPRAQATRLELALANGDILRFEHALAPLLIASDRAHAPDRPSPSPTTSNVTPARRADPSAADRFTLLSVLRHADLDLGGVDLHRQTSGQLQLRVRARDAEQHPDLAAQLATIPGVILLPLTNTSPVTVPPHADEVLTSARGLAAAVLETRLTTAQAQEDYRRGLSALTRRIMRHAAALQLADDILPDADITTLTTAAQDEWRRSTAQRLHIAIDALHELSTSLTTLDVPPPTSGGSTPQLCTTGDLLRNARTLDILTTALAGGLTPSPLSGLPTDAASATAQTAAVVETLNACLLQQLARTRPH